MFALLYPIGLIASGWSIRAYADHNVAAETEADEEEGEEEGDPNAESVWSSITNTDGLF
jgi:hypothetical protein